MKWSKSGFAAIGDRKETPRNLFGFKDGTANVTTEKEFDKVVWTDSKDWMKGGSYMALRLVQMHLETWDRTNLQEQENTFGRYKESGAPFGKKDEFDEVENIIGHAPGGVCPFGINEGIEVYLDESLKQFTTVYPAAGNDHSAVKLTIPELEQVAEANGWVDVCKETEN